MYDLVPSSVVEKITSARIACLDRMEQAATAIAAGHAAADEASAIAQNVGVSRGFMEDRTASGAADRLFEAFDSEASIAGYTKALDIGIWTHLIDFSGMSDMMDKTMKDEFRASFLDEVPEATFENVTATLEKLFGDADTIFARGLATAFSKLDRRFKSHDGFKIGGRIILENCFDSYGSWNYSSRHDDTITDVERVFAVLDGNRPNPTGLREEVNESRKGGWGSRQSYVETTYFRIRGFKNGNAHLWFTRDDLVEKANKLLANYYGEVIGDAYTDDKTPNDIATGTAVAKDLQFFGTPDKVAEMLLDGVYLNDKRVLEPSAGDGALVRNLLAKGVPSHMITAVEIHPERARQIWKACGVQARNQNFLTTTPAAIFDIVVMNPPFSGTHWMGHVAHAFKFLKPGGTLKAILPASARVNETAKHQKFRRWAEPRGSRWCASPWFDLPPESFAATGTNIQTTILTLNKGT